MTATGRFTAPLGALAAFVLAAVAVPAPAMAQQAPQPQPQPPSIAASLRMPEPAPVEEPPLLRRYSVAELEAGIIALPSAPISKVNQSSNSLPFGAVGRSLGFTKGDATILTGLHFLFRGAPWWSVGAGFLFGPSPTAESIATAPGASRSHSRNYLTVSAQGRWIPLRSRYFEGWAGLALGGVVIADHYETDTPNVYDQYPSVVGSRESNVRTEGYAVGAQAGVSWIFARSWILGFAGRVDRWFLPSVPQCDVISDCATITGSVTAFELGLTLGYRIAL